MRGKCQSSYFKRRVSNASIYYVDEPGLLNLSYKQPEKHCIYCKSAARLTTMDDICRYNSVDCSFVIVSSPESLLR